MMEMRTIPIRDIADHLVCNVHLMDDGKIQIEIRKKDIITQIDIGDNQTIKHSSFQLAENPISSS